MADPTVCMSVAIESCPPKKQCFFSCPHHSTDSSNKCFLLGDMTIISYSLKNFVMLNFIIWKKSGQTYSNCSQISSFLKIIAIFCCNGNLIANHTAWQNAPNSYCSNSQIFLQSCSSTPISSIHFGQMRLSIRSCEKATNSSLWSAFRSLHLATLLSWIAVPTVNLETSTQSSNDRHLKCSSISPFTLMFLWTNPSIRQLQPFCLFPF